MDGRIQAILCDFGLARALEMPTGLTTSTAAEKGSMWWSSPEVFLGGLKTKRSDVWAWACTVLEVGCLKAQPHKTLITLTQILLERKPYSSSATLAVLFSSMIAKTELPAALITLPEELRSMFQHCWIYDAENRARVSNCQLHMCTIVRHRAICVLHLLYALLIIGRFLLDGSSLSNTVSVNNNTESLWV